MLCCGSYIDLCGYMFASFPDVTLSPPTYHNQSHMNTCSGVAT